MHPATRKKGGRIYRMKKISVRFEKEPARDDIEIIIRADSRDGQVNALIEALTQHEPIRLTALDQENRPSIIDEKDIVFISAAGKNVQIVAVHGKYKAKQSLQRIEELLSGQFLRVSRFEIINLKMVRKYDFTLMGTLRIEFDNGMETWASRRYIPLIKEKLSREEGYLC